MRDASSQASLPRSAAGALVVFGLIGAALLAAGAKDYPDLHTILDASMFLLSTILALLLWDMGVQIDSPFPRWLAVGFALAAALELVHVVVTVEWSGPLVPIAQARGVLRPATWPPAAHILPFGVGGAIWLLRRRATAVSAFAAAMVAVGIGLLAAFEWLPAYSAPVAFGITRPTLIAAPLLWAAVVAAAWQSTKADRLMRPLALMGAVLLLANLAMLYSGAPHDMPAMLAHLGKVGGYLALLLALMKLASTDMLERIRAEARLAGMNRELEQRVQARTAELEAANLTLQSEIIVRRQAEQKAQAQLARLNLLHQITRAIGERQDLHSIFQVAVRALEDQLPVDFACLCLYDRTDHALTVACIGIQSAGLAHELAMPEQAHIPIDENGLSRCVAGRLVYEPDIGQVEFPFPRRLARGGLRALVAAPLQVESQVFGVLVVARLQAQSFSSGECEFLRQLSEHVALAAHQAQLYTALQRAYDDLRQTQQAVMQQERLRALGQMASGIAHDINNALSPVTLYTESLLETEPNLSSRATGYLQTIQRAVDDVAHTVARMKDFYRQREAQLTLAPVRLNELVQQVIDLTRARWNDMPMQRGIVIRVGTELAADAPAILGVESEIREALINLILNAVDAMPTGGRLTLRSRLAPANPGSVHRELLVEIADTGTGMDEETRRRCLEPFFTTKGERGTGLGLAMVYGVVQRHGAEIGIDSAPGQGSTVRLAFPVPVAMPDAPSVAPAPRAPARLRLLVVDDDPLLLKSMRDILEAEGHVIVTANDGPSGIATFRAACDRGERFAAVITDLGMPYVDGRKVAEAVKGAAPDMPVILLTGWGQRLLADGEIPPHVDRVLGKPPRLRELREALAQCCAPVAP